MTAKALFPAHWGHLAAIDRALRPDRCETDVVSAGRTGAKQHRAQWCMPFPVGGTPLALVNDQ